MIPVPNPIPEPEGFHERCRELGNAWLQRNPDAKRPPDYWSPFKKHLEEGFSNRCGYGAIFINYGTVDHHISCYEDITKAYEWSNYRLVDGWMNSSKSNKDSSLLLDPFEVEDGWFEILLPSLQLVVSNDIPDEFRERAEYTINNLPLRDDERIIRQRRRWYELYQQGEFSLETLRKFAPLIAKAVDNQTNTT